MLNLSNTINISHDGIQSYSLSQQESDSLREALRNIHTSPYNDYQGFAIEISSRGIPLPEELVQLLHNYRWNPNGVEGVLIRNLPVDLELPPTPQKGERVEVKKSFIAESVLELFSSFLGQVFSYNTERNGEIIHNVVPTRVNAFSASSLGYRSDFQLHTEVAYHLRLPDHVALFCLRADHNGTAATTLSSVRDAYNMLDNATKKILRQSYFRICPPESFLIDTSQTQEFSFQPIIRGSEDNPLICTDFNPGLIEIRTFSTVETDIGISYAAEPNEAKKALYSLEEHLKRVQQNIYLRTGSMIIIHNHRAVHGRTGFKARFDGQDRWLQRVYVKEDLWSSLIDSTYPQRVLKG